MNGLYNLYIPLCGLFVSVLCNIVFFSKERAKNKETSIFSRVLIYSLIDSILMVEIICLAIHNNTDLKVLEFLNKVDYAMYILFSSNFFLYVYYVTFKDNQNHKAKLYSFFFYLTTVIDVVLMILLLFMKVDVHIEGNAMYSDGMALTSTMLGCAFYFLAIVICLLINIKKAISRKLTPLYALIALFALVFILNQIDKTIVIISAVLSYVNLIMLFTIENPDMKMVQELELAKNQAEKANRAKTDFLSSMSHEIRTPLNAIVGLSQVIKDSNDLNEIHEDASDVVNASNTLLEIVNGILDISRIEADKMEIVEVAYNPLEEFKGLVTLAETRIGEKEIELRSDFAVDLPETLYGDKGKVKQIITNLLSNAVKYTEKGYIDFKVSCINENDISKLTITVSDTGRGIKKEQMDTLFTKFNRLEEDKNTTIEGTGLGLAITKSLVEMMGGKIVVDSTYGEGSKFTVFLSQKMTNETVKSDTVTLTFDGKRVLIVDDNKLNLKVINKILKEFNFDIDSCESGFECINKIENGNVYDIIFMDIMMPKMSGTETFKKLKQIENFNIPVVALTADALQGKSNKYLEVGFNDYLSKPIDKTELNRVLNKILNNVEIIAQEKEEDPNIHKVIPITDEQIEKLNKKINE